MSAKRERGVRLYARVQFPLCAQKDAPSVLREATIAGVMVLHRTNEGTYTFYLPPEEEQDENTLSVLVRILLERLGISPNILIKITAEAPSL